MKTFEQYIQFLLRKHGDNIYKMITNYIYDKLYIYMDERFRGINSKIIKLRPDIDMKELLEVKFDVREMEELNNANKFGL